MSGLAWTAFTILVALLLVNVWYCVERVHELNRTHQRHLMMINTEIQVMRDSLKDNEIQARVMGAMPVSRLIRGDDE